MTFKAWMIIIGIVIILGGAGTIVYQNDKIKNLTETNLRKDDNIKQIEQDNYTLNFKKDELAKYLNQENTQLKKDIIKIADDNDIRIKNLTKIINTQSIFITKQPIILKPIIVTKYEYKDTSGNIINASMYTFKYDSACININGKYISRDPETKVIIDSLQTRVTAYYIESLKPIKWYAVWKWFAPREIIATKKDICGETEIKELFKTLK